MPIVITTRIGGSDALFALKRGSYFCTHQKTGRPMSFFCREGKPCRAVAVANGPARVAVHTSDAAPDNRRLQAGDASAKPIVIDVCEGSLTLRLDGPHGFTESSINPDGDGVGHVRVTLLESDTVIDLRIESSVAPGVCAPGGLDQDDA
jgi:hypothetical protein